MSITAPKDKSGKFWKKLGLGKQKSSGDRTPSRPASILSRASSTDKLAEVASSSSLRIEPSESTRRNKRLSLISSYNHRRTISETTGNITRSHSTMNISVPDSQVTRSPSRTLSVTDTPVPAKPIEPESVHTITPMKSDQDMTNRTIQNNSVPSPDMPNISSSSVTTVEDTISLSPSIDHRSIPDSVDIPVHTIVPPTTADPVPTTSTRSNLPKLNTLRTAIPKASSGSSLRQQASRLRQPSVSVRSVSSHDTLKESLKESRMAASLTIVVMPATSNLNELDQPSKPADMPTNQEEIYYSLDDIQPAVNREQELSSELDRERAVIKALQGQKLAIGKDLDYLSQMVDDLTEENERLSAQLESQKEQNDRCMQDMDILLEKVKSANAGARDAEREKEMMRRELEVQNLDIESKHLQYEDQIGKKDREINRLTGQLDQSKEQIKVLKSTLEQLLRVNVVNNMEERPEPVATTPERITPATSPEIQSMKISTLPNLSQRHSINSIESEDQQSPRFTPTFENHDDQYRNVSPPNKRTSMASKRDSIYTYDGDDLDDQMRMLVKQKERLQSDYSKIPIIGGGPQSRKRQEDLEEQLDAIDSQLSKIKLKIRNR
ncbi:hypothetical protein INT44_003028, partial [Umbelopsis vinacea]